MAAERLARSEHGRAAQQQFVADSTAELRHEAMCALEQLQVLRGLLCAHCATSICFVVMAALLFLGAIWAAVTCDASKEYQGIAGTGTVSQGDREGCCVPGSSVPALILTLVCIPCLSVNIWKTSHIKNLMTGMPNVGGAQPMSTVAQPVVAVAQPVKAI